MKIHHLNCGTLCIRAGKLLIGGKGHLVCHCLLIEDGNRLVLVDTGLGTEDIRSHARRRRLWPLRLPHTKETAIEQIQKLGFDPKDVTDIVVTHLDIDHAGGLADFPWARVHISGPEYVAAMAPATLIERRRYQSDHWSHRPKWEVYDTEGKDWLGMEDTHAIKGFKDILLVPLTGHSLGHCGVAVLNEGKWLLHCGDAYYHHSEVHKAASSQAALPFKMFEKILAADLESQQMTQERIAELFIGSDQISGFCSHDAEEFALFSKNSE